MTLLKVADIRLPRRCVATVHDHLRRVGQRGYEGFGLWAGTRDDNRFQVTHAVIPRQAHIRNDDGVCVVIEADELHRLNVELYRANLTIIAQVHSHPGRAYHSDTDDRCAVATAAGCLSLVVPDFAAAPFDLRSVAAYRLDARGRWVEMTTLSLLGVLTVED